MVPPVSGEHSRNMRHSMVQYKGLMLILKAAKGDRRTGSKYIQRIELPGGKYRYIYAEDVKVQNREVVSLWDRFRAFFPFKTERDVVPGVARQYAALKIKARFNLSMFEWKNHWIEYWKRKEYWDNKFGGGQGEAKPAKDSSAEAQARPAKPSNDAGRAGQKKKGGLIRLDVMRFISRQYAALQPQSDVTARPENDSGPAGISAGARNGQRLRTSGPSGDAQGGRSPRERGKPGGDGGSPRIGLAGLSGRLTPAKQAEVNRRVLELLEARKDDASFTLEEKQLLRMYGGAGGIKGAKGVGILSEFYTPHAVVDKMWALAKQYVSPGADVLEPSAGTGRFAEGQSAYNITQIETDKTSARINRILNPQTEVLQQPFQNLFLKNFKPQKNYDGKKYDLVIGNPPYGAYAGKEKGMGEGREHKRFEEYFIDRGLDTLKPGGHMVFVVPSSFLRRGDDAIKKKIAAKGSLVEAYRLPNGAFPTTDVGTDILVVRREENGKAGPSDWLSGDKYFKKFPSRVLGKQGERKDQFGKMVPFVSGDLEALEKIKLAEPKAGASVTQTLRAAAKVQQKNVAAKKSKEPAAASELSRSQPKKETYTLGEFTKTYKLDFDDEDVKLWSNVRHDGTIDTNKVSFDGRRMAYYKGQVLPNVNYASGNIYERLDQLEREKDSMPSGQYSRQKKLLEKSLPNPKQIKDVHLSPLNSTIAALTLPDGEKLVDKFRDWIRDGVTPTELRGASFRDLIDYVDGNPVRGGTKEENEQRRRKRREVAEKLFNDFVRRDLTPGDRKIVQDAYNKSFNAYAQPDYKKIPVFLDGLSKTFKGQKLAVREHQIEGMAFLGNKGSGILAYDVGLGKTMTGINATIQSMQRGWCKRPVMVVPKAVSQNWIKEIQDLHPGVKVNYVGNMGGKNKLKGPLEEGTLTIMTYEGAQRLGFKEDTLSSLTADVHDAMKTPGGPSKSQREQEKEKQKTEQKAGQAQRGAEIFVEDLGIDHLTVDEAHNFKNVFSGARVNPKRDESDEATEVRANEFSKISGGSSDRGAKMFLLSQYVQKNNNDRGVYMLSATPFTNSPIEIYNMLMFVGRRRMRAMGINNVNDFISAFAKLKSEYVVKGNGNIEVNDVVKEFHNLPALQSLVREFIDFKSGEEVGIPRPERHDHVVELSMNESQRDVTAEENVRYNLQSRQESANAIVAINNQRMAMLSPKLVTGKGHFVKDSPKLKFTMDTALAVHKEEPDVGQVVYIPRGVQYLNEAVDYLVEKGMKRESIAILDSKTKPEREQQILADFNDPDGKTKLVIGTETIKEGRNLQGNSAVIYNTFLGFNPSEKDQLRGRIWRQGNKQKNVHTVYPTTADSIDSMLYQKLDEKSKRIGAIWSYKGDSLNVESIDPEELKFALIKDPQRRADFQIRLEKDKFKGDIEDRATQISRLKQFEKTLGGPDMSERYDELATEERERIKNAKALLKDTPKTLVGRKIALENQIESAKRQLAGLTRAKDKAARERERALHNLAGLKVAREDIPSAIKRLEEEQESLEAKVADIESRRDHYVDRAKKDIAAKQQSVPSVEAQVTRKAEEIIKSIRSGKSVQKSGFSSNQAAFLLICKGLRGQAA